MQSQNTRNLTRRYIIALSTIAILAIVGQALIQFSLTQQSSDARVINIAGRQRMLSQRLTKAALALQNVNSETVRAGYLSEFEDAFTLWTRSHVGLQQGDETLGLPPENSATIIQLFAQIEPQYQAIRSAAQCILVLNDVQAATAPETCGETESFYVDTILTQEGAFLAQMDEIVFQYDAESTAGIQLLSRIEVTLLIVTLIVLLLEAFLIFRPAIQKIEQTLRELLKTQQQLENRIIEVQVARDEAERANQVKSAFLASMSHELRTPLNAVINFTKFVAKGDLGPVNEEQRQTLGEVVDSARHLLNLINDVLDMSKIESGSLKLFVTDNIDLQAIINQVVSTGKGLLDGKTIDVQANVAKDLPTVRGDRQRLVQILLNIMSNACKFTQEGSITVSAYRTADDVVIAVTDTGPGIAPKDHAAVFEAFKQTETGLRQGGGTGLGMPITKSLVEAHGGCLRLESQAGAGTTFTVTLPIKSDLLVPTLKPERAAS